MLVLSFAFFLIFCSIDKLCHTELPFLIEIFDSLLNFCCNLNKKLKFLLPQLVKLYLVDNICEEVTNRVNTMLYEQDFKELNEEDPKVEKERKMLKSKVENLDAALETILRIKEIKDAELKD